MTVAYTNPSPDDERDGWEEMVRERARRATLEDKARRSPEVANRASSIARDHPHLPPGVVHAAAEDGIADDGVIYLSDAVARIQNTNAEFASGTDNPWYIDVRDTAFRAVKATTRWGIQGLQELGQPIRRVQHAAAAAASNLSEDEVSKGSGFTAVNPGAFIRNFREEHAASESTAFSRLLRGEEADIGSGFFPRDRTFEEGLSRNRLASGLQADAGNTVLDRVDFVEPGTRAYEVWHGAINMANEIATSPDLFLDAPVRGAISASKAFVPAGAKLSEMGALAKVNAFGLIDEGYAVRKGVIPEIAVDEWLMGSREGTMLRQWLQETDDFEAIRQRLRHVDLSRKLADTDDMDEIARLLKQKVGLSAALRTGASAPLSYKVSRASTTLGKMVDRVAEGKAALQPLGVSRPFRIGNWTPRSSIPLTNADEGVEQFQRWMVNAKLPEETIARRTREFADGLLDEGPLGGRKVYNNVVKSDLKDDLLERGHDKDVVNSLVKDLLYGDAENVGNVANRAFWIDDATSVKAGAPRHAEYPGVTLSEEGVPLPDPMLVVEHADEAIDVTRTAAIRRATGTLSRLVNVPGVRRAIQPTGLSAWSTIDFAWLAQRSVWVPLQLITRIAWPARIVAEEQARMWGSGLDGAFNSPLSYWGYTLGLKGSRDVLGSPLAQSRHFQDAQTRRMVNVLGDAPDSLQHRDWGGFLTSQMDTDAAVDLWRIEYGKALKDDSTQRAARALIDPEDSMDEAVRWFLDSDDRQVLASVNSRKRGLVDDAAAREAGFDSADDMAEAHMKDVVRRLEQNFGGNHELIESIANREIRGTRAALGEDVDIRKIQDTMTEVLSEHADDAMPKFLPGPMGVVDEAFGDAAKRMADQAVQKLWYGLGAYPSNKLSRSPVFVQSYWRRGKELLTWADDETKTEILNRARSQLGDYSFEPAEGIVGRLRDAVRAEGVKGGLRDVVEFRGNKTLLDELEQAARSVDRGAGGGRIQSVEEFDLLAKEYALQTSNDLLYALHKRGHFAEATRLIFPFAEAWKEIGQTWLKVLGQNPVTLHKAQIAVDGARETGFLYTDPNSGDEMFAIPGSGVLNRLFFGESDPASVRFSPSVALEGVNLFAGSVLPGFGPVVQWPANALIPEHPKYDGIRETLLPFGGEDPFTEPVKSLLPAWMGKLLTGLSEGKYDERLWNGTIADSMTALAAANPKKYEGEGAKEKLLDDATSLAKKIILFRAGAQATWLAGPQVRFQFGVNEDESVKRKVGEAVLAENGGDLESLGNAAGPFLSSSVLTAYYYSLLSHHEGDGHAALEEFVGTVGEDMGENMRLLGLMFQGKYETIEQHASSEVGEKWERANARLSDELDQVIGYLAPEPNVRDAGITAFIRQVEEGSLQSLTPEQFFDEASKGIAWTIYQNQAEKVEGRNDKEARLWKQAWRTELDRRFPGWRNETPGIPADADFWTQLDQLEQAVHEEAILDTEAGKGLAEWLPKFQEVVALVMEEEGFEDRRSAIGSLFEANKHSDRRRWLKSWAEQTVRTYPEFAPLWRRVLRNQFRESSASVASDTESEEVTDAA